MMPMAFSELELAALRAIFAETPALAGALETQLRSSVVIRRENSGAGFFTTIAVVDHAPLVIAPPVLGDATHARVDGLSQGLGLILHLKAGRMHELEGFCWGPDSTRDLDLTSSRFAIYHQPAGSISPGNGVSRE